MSDSVRLVRFGLLVAVVAGLAVFDLVILFQHATADGMHDFGAFYHGARRLAAGLDPYQLPAEAARGGWLNLNPPHFLLLILPIAWLPARLALVAWSLVVLGAAFLSVRLIVRELRLRIQRESWLWLAVLALAWPGAVATVWSGGVGYVLMLPVTLAWRAARRGQWGGASTWLGLAMSWKLFLAVFLPYLAWQRPRAFVLAVVTVAGVAATGVALFGTAAYESWLAMLARVTWEASDFNASLLGLLTRLLAWPSTAPWAWPDAVRPAWMVGSVVIAGVTAAAAGMSGRMDACRVDSQFALCGTAALLISPLGWIHYLVIVAGPVAALVVETVRHRPVSSVPSLLGACAAMALLWPRVGMPAVASVYFWGLLAGWLALVLFAAAGAPRGASVVQARAGAEGA